MAVAAFIQAGGVTAGAITAAVFTKRENRRREDAATAEADRQRDLDREQDAADWRRDQVTTHYLELRQAVQELSRTYIEDVVGCYNQTPVVGVDEAYVKLRQAQERMIEKTMDVSVVARDQVMEMLYALWQVDVEVMVPLASPNGSPKAALDRGTAEYEALVSISAMLTLAMRADLGLLPEPAVRELATMRQEALIPRSLLEPRDLATVLSFLTSYGVAPLEGPDYVISTETVAAIRETYPHWSVPINGLLIKSETLHLGVAETVDADQKLELMLTLSDLIESGMRGHPTLLWRDGVGGSRIYVV